MAYVRIESVANQLKSGKRLMSVEKGENPYPKLYDPDGLDDPLNQPNAWKLWFSIVQSVDPQLLKQKVPEDFWGLIDEKDLCPTCGHALGYRPWTDREYMVVTCPCCGTAELCVTESEKHRAEQWRTWQVAHNEPTSFMEAMRRQSMERQ